jgi:hypothetical protein
VSISVVVEERGKISRETKTLRFQTPRGNGKHALAGQGQTCFWQRGQMRGDLQEHLSRQFEQVAPLILTPASLLIRGRVTLSTSHLDGSQLLGSATKAVGHVDANESLVEYLNNGSPGYQQQLMKLYHFPQVTEHDGT